MRIIKHALVAMLMLCWRVVQAASCSGHDIETTYGAYDYFHEVTSFVYAIDTDSSDIVVAGTAGFGHYERHFIYYIDNTSCQVKWHYLMDEDDVSISGFESLEIRS